MNNITEPTPCFLGISQEDLIPNHDYVARKNAILSISYVEGSVDIYRNGRKSYAILPHPNHAGSAVTYMIAQGDVFSIKTRGARQVVITGNPIYSEIDFIKEELKNIKGKIEQLEYENLQMRKQILKDL